MRLEGRGAWVPSCAFRGNSAVALGPERSGAVAQNFDLATILPNEQKVDDLFRADIHLSELGQKRYAQIFVSIAAKAVAAGRQGCS
ncbi:hypothetical protein DF3PB_550009 [uncultured Defluviicoccus sp.]|uniref:Uncharacterized protein n=1 Tax=metagenome TaxID=256318 RepID=A0A380TJ06_9ZZZZ|nr:hypothetical protein DF3PB_550009 [uncultured Defluviicoccus sp.]